MNGNNVLAFNNFIDVPQIPYKIIEVLITNNSQEVEDFWKMLKYADIDCLGKPNLSMEEKKNIIWNGDSIENQYSIFFKPLIGSAMDTAVSQIQLRLFRYSIYPTTQLEAIICFEADFITNEKSSLVRKDGVLMERTDLMETTFLNFMNGRDIKVGSGYFSFDKELSRSCDSQLNISNSKSFYGRSLIMGIRYMYNEVGVDCDG